jgi:hypothetical protein
MPTVMNRAQFRKQLNLGLNTVFGWALTRHKEEWKEIYEEYSSEKAYEEDVLVAGLGGAKIKAEGGAVSYDSGAEAWTARYKMETVALAIAITEEAVEDGLYGDLGAKYAKELARSFQYTKNVHGAQVLNFGFSSTGPNGVSTVGGDGVPLFSNAHPLWGGGTSSNVLSVAADLAEPSLEDMLTLIDSAVDDRQIPIAITARKLIVSKWDRYNAERLTQTQLRPTSSGDTFAKNDINATRNLGMLPDGYTVNHFLTDQDAWFILTDVDEGMKYFDRVALEGGMEGDFETGNLRFKKRARYKFGWTNWRAMYGSPGA